MKTEILKEVKSLMVEELDLESVDDLTDDAAMNDMPEWDSLGHVNLMLAIQEKYDIEISPEEIAFTLCLPDIVDLIQSKLDAPEEPGRPGHIPSLSVWEELFSRLWADDELRQDDTIYIHSQAKGLLKMIGGNLSDAIRHLKTYDHGDRTLVFPAFPFSSKTYRWYLSNKPRFSVANTSTLTGLLPEMIRMESNVYRSAHPILSECAVGPKAEWITKDAHLDPHPFHEKSTYARLLALDAAMIGLGVDANTNAILHFVDDKFRSRYPFELYLKDPVAFEIELKDGSVVKRSYLAYSPDMVERIKPRNLRPFFADYPQILTEFEIDDLWFFRLRIRPFLEMCTSIAQDHLERGDLPPWFKI